MVSKVSFTRYQGEKGRCNCSRVFPIASQLMEKTQAIEDNPVYAYNVFWS